MVHGPITVNVSSRALGLLDLRVGNSADNIANIAAVFTAANSLGALQSTKFLSSKEFFEQFSGFPQNLDGIVPLKSTSSLDGEYKELTPFNIALSQGLNPTASVTASVSEDVALVSALGTRNTSLSIALVDGTPTDWAPINEEWTVVFTGATAGAIFGKATGHVHTFSALNAAMAPVDGNSKKYFSIPADFFTGTWAANDSYVFYTSSGGDSTYASAHSGNIGLGNLVAPADIRVEGVYTFPDGIHTMTFIFPRAQAAGDLDLAFSETDEAAPAISLRSMYAGSRNVNGNAVWDEMPQGRIVWA